MSKELDSGRTESGETQGQYYLKWPDGSRPGITRSNVPDIIRNYPFTLLESSCLETWMVTGDYSKAAEALKMNEYWLRSMIESAHAKMQSIDNPPTAN